MPTARSHGIRTINARSSDGQDPIAVGLYEAMRSLSTSESDPAPSIASSAVRSPIHVATARMAEAGPIAAALMSLSTLVEEEGRNYTGAEYTG